jgi:starvation-inducible DNA-binding protein
MEEYMKHLESVQTYLSNLAVLFVKLHNVHWNVVGNQFLRIHTFTEELYDQIFEDFDEVAELLKTKGVMPLATEIRNDADEAGDFETVAMFEEFVAFYSKNIWFIEAMKK